MNVERATLVTLKPRAPQAAVDGGSAHGQLLSAAYAAFHRRVACGEKLDAQAYCEQFPPVQSSLAKMFWADQFIVENPELLVDAPASWPEVAPDAEWEGFKLLAELGRGAFARVYLAQELALGGRLVAVKCTSFGAREAATLGRLDHPGVVPIHFIRDLPDHNMTVVCMPYLGHATLQQVCTYLHGLPRPALRAVSILQACEDERLPAPLAPPILRRGAYLDGVRWLAARIAGALGYLHAHGISHRDLKPSNILLQPDGAPRLLDFNLSADTLLPKAQVGGTLHYMAPEQLEAMEHGDAAGLTQQIDVFALGVILFEWLTGSHPCAPLPADKNAATLAKHLLKRYQDIDQSPPPLPGVESSLARVVQSCLRMNPTDRPTAVAVESALQRQLRPERRLARRLARSPLKAASIAVLLVGGAFAFGAYRASTAPARAEAAFAKGWEAFRAGAYHDAIAHFDKAAGQGAEWHFARARAYQRLGESNKSFLAVAEVEYAKADKAMPSGKYSAGRAYCVHRLKAPAAVVELHYQTALGRGFNSLAVHHNLGCLYKDAGKFENAQSHFEQALAIDDGSRKTQCQMASLLAARYLDVTPNPADAKGPMPELLGRALKHLDQGLPDIKTAPAGQAIQIARILALAAPFSADRADAALAWLERAMAAGSPVAAGRDTAFRPLAANQRYLALLQQPPSGTRPVADWNRLLDPLDE